MSSTASPHTLSVETLFNAEEVERFQRDGYAIVKGLAGGELVSEMTDATLLGLERRIEPIEYEADVQYPGSPSSRTAEGGGTIRRLKEAQSRHPSFTRLVTSPAVVGRLRQLLGPRIVLPLAHHNCVMTKQPAYSSETHWHQDIRYWSYQQPELVSLWVALRRETKENGCLQLIPGSHRAEYPRSSYDDALFFRQDLPENQKCIATKIHAELEPGDALFFHCRTLHAAGRNQTAEPKFSVVFTFRPEQNSPRPGSRSAAMPELLLPDN